MREVGCCQLMVSIKIGLISSKQTNKQHLGSTGSTMVLPTTVDRLLNQANHRLKDRRKGLDSLAQSE